jgi:serine phosphatase RsbU (regulator of sigma subunit)
MLTTAFYMVADWKTGIMRFSNAGHPKPLHVRRGLGRVELLQGRGKCQPALGLFDGAQYQASEIKLAANDLVMMFTDGLCDVDPPSGEYFTQDHLVAAVTRRLQLPATRLFDELLEEINKFSDGRGFCDDVCIVGMEVAGTVAA